MNENPYLPLVALKEIEENLSWEPYEQGGPTLLFKDFARMFAVQANTVNDNIIKSSNKPSAKDRGKLWIKESWPYAIVSIIDGEYRADYGLSGLTPNVPFLHIPFEPALEYVSIITTSDLVKYGIADTNSEATNRMRWHIFEPPTINI